MKEVIENLGLESRRLKKMSRHLSTRTANPALQSDTFKKALSGSATAGEVMTVNGVVNKTGFALLLLIISASITWADPALAGLAIIGMVTSIIAALQLFLNPQSHILLFRFIISQGLVLGMISQKFNQQYPGIVQAIFLTFGTLGSLLLAYMSGLIKATENFKLGVFAARSNRSLYLINFIMSFLYGYRCYS